MVIRCASNGKRIQRIQDPDFEYEAISRIVRGYVVWFVNGKKVSELPLTSVRDEKYENPFELAAEIRDHRYALCRERLQRPSHV